MLTESSQDEVVSKDLVTGSTICKGEYYQRLNLADILICDQYVFSGKLTYLITGPVIHFRKQSSYKASFDVFVQRSAHCKQPSAHCKLGAFGRLS